MPPRLPSFAAAASLRRCVGDLIAAQPAVRLPALSVFAVPLSSSAPRAVPRQHPPSSGAAFLNLDHDASSARPQEQQPQQQQQHIPPTQPPPSTLDTSAALSRVLFDTESRRRFSDRLEAQKRTALERLAERKVSDDYARMLPRRWRVGDLYAPHDLSAAEATKWRAPARQPTRDVLDVLGVDPRDEYRNFALVSGLVNSMGRIYRGRVLGLRGVNQRRVARTVRRAIGAGLHPSVHKHPELLSSQLAQMPKKNFAAPTSRRHSLF
ncbi:37S ribosomal protein [Niveomyces insectorum RCEF 264]|uniref:Small ribosomal subunit protein bS18m n=1 Tax=Niveomyces insectorum RCEF 264 TaxID=1081102 RepID=A0A167USN4_9HYPO|nr:37S ribosomal protein [Niveomyces insectorum RCEF 264]